MHPFPKSTSRLPSPLGHPYVTMTMALLLLSSSWHSQLPIAAASPVAHIINDAEATQGSSPAAYPTINSTTWVVSDLGLAEPCKIPCPKGTACNVEAHECRPIDDENTPYRPGGH